jgi:hypothetical protein
MKILYKNSLAKTIDAVNDFFFFGRTIPRKERVEVCDWIADRQGMHGAYAKMFAPTDHDFKHGIRVFTGERVISGAAIGHIMGEEACRVLRLLKSPKQDVKDALRRANLGMNQRLMGSGRFEKSAIYCCGICTVSIWRNIAAGGLKPNRKNLKRSLRTFRKYRDGNGKWRIFPFYYTLLSLLEIGSNEAWAELQYAGRVIERLVTRQGSGKYGKRRKVILESILKKI